MRGSVTFEISVGVIFIVILVIGVSVLTAGTVGGPSVEIYGNKQAALLAKSVALSVNAMTTAEEGTIERFLKGEWDIVIGDGKVTFSHDDFSGSEKILVEAEDVSIGSARKIDIVKEPGKPVSVRRGSV